ncbi:MAG TPA: FG-GAP-like repeat-containing protein [Candidatus Deferrimicrobium sp.]|nr:FG-GAP-like repeat-containing protein [Candidatus Deferrimicrobium sp.]
MRQAFLVCVAFSGMLSLANAQPDPWFAPAVNYAAGDRPFSVFAADLDGDSDYDLAVANAESNNVSILKNNGNGTFQTAVNYGAGGTPFSVFAADLDGDSDYDLAVANVNWDNVSILKNNGNGTFAAAGNYGAGDKAYSVFAADLDGDSDYDLAVANYRSDNVSILKNNGNGTFAAAVNYGAGDWPYSVFAADLDGDSDYDLAVANCNSKNVSILKNNGDGTFQTAVNYGAGGNPQSVFAADLDGDSNYDLAVASAGSNNVSILKNNGDGTYQAAVNYGANIYPSSVFAADLDEDGDDDLAVANYHSANVSILKNNGDGTFQTAVNFGAGVGPRSVFAADLDDDSDYDLAVVNELPDNVSILINLSNVGPPAFCTGFAGLFCDDFEDGVLTQWQTLRGSCSWSESGGILSTSEVGQEQWCILTVGDQSWDNYVLEAKVRGNSGVDKVLVFRVQDANNYYAINLRSDYPSPGIDQLTFDKMINGVYNADIVTADYPSQNGVWYHLKVACADNSFKVYVDDALVLEYSDDDNPYYTGGIGVACWTGYYGSCGVSFDNVAVTNPFPVISFNSPGVEFYVGDYVTTSGMVTTNDGSPYVPADGFIGVEDPIGRLSANVPVTSNGSFSYTTPTPAEESGMWMFRFGESTELGLVEKIFNVLVKASGEPQESWPSPRVVAVDAGRMARPLAPAVDVLSARNGAIGGGGGGRWGIKEQNKSAWSFASWGHIKSLIQTSWQEATGSGVNRLMFQKAGTFAENCNPAIPWDLDCSNLTIFYAYFTFTAAMDLEWNVFHSWTDYMLTDPQYDCFRSQVHAALDVGELTSVLITLNAGKTVEAIDVVDGVLEGMTLDLVEPIENSLETCVNSRRETGFVLPFLAARFESNSLGSVLIGLVPRYEQAVVINGYSPIEITVVDPAGRYVNSDTSTIVGANYMVFDSDLDGEVEQLVVVPLDTVGEIQVIIEPGEGASPNDTFSVIADYSFYANPVVLADNELIINIPPTPYVCTTFVNLAPDSFGILSPHDSAFHEPLSIPFVWESTSDPNPDHMVYYDLLIASDSLFNDIVVLTNLTDTTYLYTDSLPSDTIDNVFFWKVRAHDLWWASTFSEQTLRFTFGYICGNIDGIVGPGGPVDVADLTYLVAYLFQGGAAPPILAAANVDGINGPGGPVDVADLTYLVAYLFQGGQAPVC